MHTTRLCTSSVFSTTRICSACVPVYPMEAMAAVPPSRSQRLNAGSLHARATIAAPFLGPTLCSNVSMMASTSADSARPFSTNSDYRALTRSSTSEGGSV